MSEEYKSKLASQRRLVVDFIKACVLESRTNEKKPRRDQNILNWNYFHGTIDWSHKRDEDPKIHLHKIGVAAERMRAKFKGALMKYDNWLDVEREYFPENPILPNFVAKNILFKQLKYAKAETVISDAILRGVMESRIALKIGGKYVTKPRFVKKDGKLVKEEKSVWQLELVPLSFEGLHLDSENDEDKLYQIEECRVDYNRIYALASEEQTPDKPYDLKACESLSAMKYMDADEAEDAAKGNVMDINRLKNRRQILIWNFYGTILDDNGKIMEWETEDGKKMPLENIFCCVANEDVILMDPMRNTRWSAKAPFVFADPIRSPNQGRKALLDAGTLVNQAEDELFSLMLAGAMKSVHNVTWYREDMIADKRAISGGIRDGDQIAIDSSGPANAEPMGVMTTGKVPQEAFAMQGTLDRVFAENVISNQIDLSGNLPGKQVRSTELVQASAAIGDVFDSMSGDVEKDLIVPLAEECLYEIIQHIDDMDEAEVRSCFEDRQDLADAFFQLPARERFEQISGTMRFVGKGLHGLIANQAKAQALINLASTIQSNPMTAAAVESTISTAKLIREIAKGMGLDVEQLAPSEEEKAMIQQKQMIQEQALAQMNAQGASGAGGTAQAAANPSQGSMPSPEQPGPGGGL